MQHHAVDLFFSRRPGGALILITGRAASFLPSNIDPLSLFDRLTRPPECPTEAEQPMPDIRVRTQLHRLTAPLIVPLAG